MNTVEAFIGTILELKRVHHNRDETRERLVCPARLGARRRDRDARGEVPRVIHEPYIRYRINLDVVCITA